MKIEENLQLLNKNILITTTKSEEKMLIKDLYYNIQNQIDEVHVFCNSDLNHHYQGMTNAFYGIDFNNFDLIKYCEENRDIKKLIIIDNILLKKNDNLTFLFLNGKCYDITLIISNEFVQSFDPEIRNNLDYFFTAKHSTHQEIQNLFCSYYIFFTTMEEFKEKMECLQPYEFLITGSKPIINKYQIRNHKQIF